MPNPQKENGYVGIANDLWDALTRAKLNGSERSCIDFVLRLTYGCHKNGKYGEEAILEYFSDLEVAGIGKSHIAETIRSLIKKNMIRINRCRERDDKIKIRFNKRYSTWNVEFAIREKKYRYLIGINLALFRSQKVTGSSQNGTESSEKGTGKDKESGKQLPKGNRKVPKRELLSSEKGTLTGAKSSDGAASSDSKPGLNHGKTIPKEPDPVITTGGEVENSKPEKDKSDFLSQKDEEEETSEPDNAREKHMSWSEYQKKSGVKAPWAV